MEEKYLGGSVGAGHVNQWLAAVHAQRPCPEKEWTDSTGNWDKVRMTAEDSFLDDYQEHGLWWWLVVESIEK